MITKEEAKEAIEILGFIPFKCFEGTEYEQIANWEKVGKVLDIAITIIRDFAEGRLVKPMSRSEIFAWLNKYTGISRIEADHIANALSNKISAQERMSEEEMVDIIRPLLATRFDRSTNDMAKEIAKALKKGNK